MRQFLDDYDELDEIDESSFESFAANRRLLGNMSKVHQKDAGRKRRSRAHHDRFVDDDRDSLDDNDDFSGEEFDRHYESGSDD